MKFKFKVGESVKAIKTHEGCKRQCLNSTCPYLGKVGHIKKLMKNNVWVIFKSGGCSGFKYSDLISLEKITNWRERIENGKKN